MIFAHFFGRIEDTIICFWGWLTCSVTYFIHLFTLVSFSFGKINKCSWFKASKAFNWNQAGNQFKKVSFGKQLSLTIIKCTHDVKLQFVVIPGKGVMIEKKPFCLIEKPLGHSGQWSGVNRFKRSINSYRFLTLRCSQFAVIVPESQSENKIYKTNVVCI